MDEASLMQVLATIVAKIDALEKGAANARRPDPPPSEALSRALQAFARGGPPAPHEVGREPDGGAYEGQPQPPRSPLLVGFEADEPGGEPRLPRRVAPRERSELAALSGSGIRDDLPVDIKAGTDYAPAPPPRDAAIEGSQFIRAVDDSWVQVRTEDGKLLGAMPTFGGDVDRVYTQQRQELSVGMIAVRAVVVPYNAGVDPFTIQGFVPAPGVQKGPLSTGAVGLNVNLDNPDIGRRV